MLQAGGTTFWEAFDADKKTLSLNHWTHSACGEWLWRDVAGLNPDPDAPGYRAFIVRPRPSKEVAWCKASYHSVRGPIKVDWQVVDGEFTLDLQVPAGSEAQVNIPGEVSTVREGGMPVTNAQGVKYLKSEDAHPVYEVASGHYRFTANTHRS